MFSLCLLLIYSLFLSFAFVPSCSLCLVRASRRCSFCMAAHRNRLTWQHAVLCAPRACVCVCAHTWWSVGREPLPCCWTRYISVLLFHLSMVSDLCSVETTALKPSSFLKHPNKVKKRTHRSLVPLSPITTWSCLHAFENVNIFAHKCGSAS